MKYSTPRAFRTALGDRLRLQAAREGIDLGRLQRQLAYERFLTRLFGLVGDQWVLKGGYALELRLGGRARATQDLDFNAPGSADLLDTLQEAADHDSHSTGNGTFKLFLFAQMGDDTQCWRGAEDSSTLTQDAGRPTDAR